MNFSESLFYDLNAAVIASVDMFFDEFHICMHNANLSILKKSYCSHHRRCRRFTENGPLNYEKTNSFRNIKFGIQIAFSMKMCKMPSSKMKDQWEPRCRLP